MSKLETSGYKGWWEVKQYLGKDKNGVKRGKEVFRNMITGEVYDPGEKGWNGEPPYPTGDMATVRHVSDAYRRNYDLIVWDRDREAQDDTKREYNVEPAICQACGHEFAAIYDVYDYALGEEGKCPKCGQISANLMEVSK
jgi:predicted Zn-ribbon and HTH transcriptional regulator